MWDNQFRCFNSGKSNESALNYFYDMDSCTTLPTKQKLIYPEEADVATLTPISEGSGSNLHQFVTNYSDLPVVKPILMGGNNLECCRKLTKYFFRQQNTTGLVVINSCHIRIKRVCSELNQTYKCDAKKYS